MQGSLPAHFESHGSLESVRRDIEDQLPILISDLPDHFIPSLCALIEKYSVQYKWDVIVLDVSRGLARHILNDMTHVEVHAKNGIIIDPCGSTPEHTVVESEKLLKVNKERLIIANEATEDILVILYGVDQIDRKTDLELLKRHLLLVGVSLDSLTDDNEETIEDTIKRDEIIRQRNKKILESKMALTAFKTSLKPMEDDPNDSSGLFGANGTLFMLYVTITSLQFTPVTGVIEDRLEFLIQQVRLIPNYFKSLEFDLKPYIDAALGVSQNELKFEQSFSKKQKKLGLEQEPKLKKNALHGPQLNPE